MLQRVTLNVIQVFQRIFDAINPCIIIYEYINVFFSVLLPFISIVVYGGVMVVFEKCCIKTEDIPFFVGQTVCKHSCHFMFTYPVYVCL